MIAPRWRKVFRDIWRNKSRTVLVVFSIAIGVGAIGMVATTNQILSKELPENYAKVNPAHARILTSSFDDELLNVLDDIEGIDEIEGRYNIGVRMKVGPEEWRDIDLAVFEDFNEIKINRFFPESGAWPAGDGQLLVERASLVLTQASQGDIIEIETPNGQRRKLVLAGLTHDINQPAGTFTNQPKGYINFNTLESFGYGKGYNEILLTVENENPTRIEIREITKEVESKIEKSGRIISGTIIPNPGQHWFQNFLTPMAAILTILGIIIILISSLLIINTITATMAQQVRQIGMMKAVGATTGQLITLYEFSLLLIGLIALLIAIPMSIFGTQFAIGILTGIINFDVIDISIPIQVLLLQVTLCIFIPMIVALIPILSGARITVNEAINDYGLKATFGEGWIDKALSYIRGLPRPILLSLRNTFRRKSRLILTLLALILGSAIFVGVISTYFALIGTLDEALSYYGFDIIVSFNRPYRIEQIESEITNYPGVVDFENWGITSTRILNSDGSESNSIILVAPPVETKLINPTILAGRWLLPDDEQAIVINTDVLTEAPDVRVGHEILMNIDGTPKPWRVVGITRSVMAGPMAYTNYPYFTRVMGRYGLSSAVYLSTVQHDQQFQEQVAKSLEEHFEKRGINVASSNIVAELRNTAVTQFNVIFLFLLMMAILLTVVGAFGLAGTMGLNVIERTREIGVMRAIGASNGDVSRIVVFEGVVIGIISWIFGVLLAYPLGWLLTEVMGRGFLRSPITYIYSYQGAFGWLIAVIIMAAIASYLPARSATRVPVRDVLAYE